MVLTMRLIIDYSRRLFSSASGGAAVEKRRADRLARENAELAKGLESIKGSLDACEAESNFRLDRMRASGERIVELESAVANLDRNLSYSRSDNAKLRATIADAIAILQP